MRSSSHLLFDSKMLWFHDELHRDKLGLRGRVCDG